MPRTSRGEFHRWLSIACTALVALHQSAIEKRSKQAWDNGDPADGMSLDQRRKTFRILGCAVIGEDYAGTLQ